MAAKPKPPTKPAGKKPAKPKKPKRPSLRAALEEGGPPPLRRGPGAPTLFRPTMLETARKLYGAGATDLEVADALGIGSSTLYLWLQKNPAFREAANMGLDAACDRVERALFNRAVGYSYDSEKIFCTALGVERVPIREHVPPDPKAALIWLKNLRKDRWKDSKEIEGKVQLAELLKQGLEGAA